MAYSQDRPAIDAARARQGGRGRSVFWVLVFGIALTVLGFAATWAWKAGDFAGASNSAERASPAAAATYNAPRPDAASRQNYDKGGPVAPQNGGNPS
ncbi:MAG: hypothetical protein E7812_12290 [Phenylobacterium sp.]|nr:MAG: hypothetical protein E7812_12290 [Phenylobacterium sp.]